MKHTIEKIDFDEAVSQPWNAFTCLLAQFARRVKRLDSAGRPNVWSLGKDALALRTAFDLHFKRPGDENKPKLQKLRDSLPIEINIP